VGRGPYHLEYVEGLNDARTTHGNMEKGASLGKEVVLAASGRAGEKNDFFSILLEEGVD
jgi:hypothetical protein